MVEKQLAFQGEFEDFGEIVADYADEPVTVSEYWITSYGIDYDVEGIVRRIRKKDIDFPGFQRNYVWDISRASRFIESLLLKLPVPGIFLYREPDSQKQIVIDGQQRLETLRRFYEGTFDNSDFALDGVREPFNGYRYADFTDEARRKLDDSIIHATVIRQDKPDDSGSSKFEIFERLNSYATPLSPQEIRAAIYDGSFNSLLLKMNDQVQWRNLFGKHDKRARDVELILRFLALYYEKEYQSPMKSFLNSFMSSHREIQESRAREMWRVFDATTTTILNKIGVHAFRPNRRINAAAADALMVGIARRLERGEICSDITEQYQCLKGIKNFQESIAAGTSQSANVSIRLQIATEIFADVE